MNKTTKSTQIIFPKRVESKNSQFKNLIRKNKRKIFKYLCEMIQTLEKL